MIPLNSKKTNKPPVTSADLDSPVNVDYQPAVGSALESVHKQARGSALNERDQFDIHKHNHDGANSEKINLRSIDGFFQTVSAVPNWTPRNAFEQIAVYKNGATIRLYIYDTENKAWRYTALT